MLFIHCQQTFIKQLLICNLGLPKGLTWVKNLLVVQEIQETTGSIPELGRSAGGGHATHSGVLAQEMKWTEGYNPLYCIESGIAGMTQHSTRVNSW